MRTIRIDDDVWHYLQTKAKAFEDAPNDVLRRELKLDSWSSNRNPRQETTSDHRDASDGNSKETALSGSRPTDLNGRRRSDDLRPDKDYTHYSVRGYCLDGRLSASRSFKDVLIGVCECLRRIHLGEFDKVATSLKGKTRVYFSSNPRDLKFPEELSGDGLFVETNLNANLIVGICRKLLEKLGHDLKTFRIE